MRTGSPSTRLVVLRGNSASGKSSIALTIRERFGRGVALVGQDNLRRTVLGEQDRPGAANIGLIDTVTRHCLDAGFHVVLEGILHTAHYEPMLTALRADHRGVTRCYYLDVPFEETLRRHATKPQAVEYGEAEMRGWYRPLDLLAGSAETVVPAHSSLHATVSRILRDTGLDRLPARQD
ncbi:AAA family ATPase [Streptacidiphilus jiangxiensis]|uniref:Kinase n=1 Tax=Streptacidiphilus jiangxiensis TaxID=235985 RepID=A0A1H7P0Z7_STRJI|nr:AAA family ATPase [Streptacidiphilus jiangxiensis]SEL28978.1 hypothetical protein SAMN05414137_107149 [Streptacidiphilus jiangxiensis]